MAESDATGDEPIGDEGSPFTRLKEIFDRLSHELWYFDAAEPWAMRILRATTQLVFLTVRGFHADQLLLRASALAFVTALSIIPLLGVVVAILGVFGGDETLVDFAIDQLTSVAPEVRETVRDYAIQLDFRQFGAIGGAIVFGTAILALRHLEETLNDIWGVVSPRTWARRFADYLAVIVVAPVSAGIAVSLATTLQSGPVVARMLEDPGFARFYGLGLTQLPVFVLFLGFTFLYWFFPNTEVRVRAAALGGAVAAVLFAMARTVYVEFQVGAATYQAVFGALSAVPLILAWLYACWAVLLLGAEVAFAMQNLPFARREMRSGDANMAEREAVALEIAVTAGRHFRDRLAPPTGENLADVLDEPVRLVRRLCDDLETAGILRRVESGDSKDAGFVPAAPLRELTVGAVLRAVRGNLDDATEGSVPLDPEVASMLGQLEQVWSRVADEESLEALCGRPESGITDASA